MDIAQATKERIEELCEKKKINFVGLQQYRVFRTLQLNRLFTAKAKIRE